jgi:hypothetical protein
MWLALCSSGIGTFRKNSRIRTLSRQNAGESLVNYLVIRPRHPHVFPSASPTVGIDGAANGLKEEHA